MSVRRLETIPRELEACLTLPEIRTPPDCREDEVRREAHGVIMRDAVTLATDVYLPPMLPAPVVVRRTPYGRSSTAALQWILPLAIRGFAVVAQDCRGTGESEPNVWDYYVYEAEDSIDCIDWVRRQPWADGFIGACGASYAAQTQWCMARHPAMSAIVPEVSGLGVAANTASLHMFLNAYSRSVGKGEDVRSVGYEELERTMLAETLASGSFDEPIIPPILRYLLSRSPELQHLTVDAAQEQLWRRYCKMSGHGRSGWIRSLFDVERVTITEIEGLPQVFGRHVAHDAHTVPAVDQAALMESLHASPLMITGWYDWGLNDALATWASLQRHAAPTVRARARLIITPSAHRTAGYHEGAEAHPELRHNHRVVNHIDLLVKWFDAIRKGDYDEWPRVIYYLMGAHQWRAASTWPPENMREEVWYLGADRSLSRTSPVAAMQSLQFVYDPADPTPTVGGSIVSAVYRPGSVDVGNVQKRADVLSFTSDELREDLTVVGPLCAVIFASSSARDTDFVVRLSDVFPDGRAIQLQNGLLRARYRTPRSVPQLLTPGEIYRFEIDMWATANCFQAGHRIRIDLSSADFPRFDRNSNGGGETRGPVKAVQTIYLDAQRPSHVLLQVAREELPCGH